MCRHARPALLEMRAVGAPPASPDSVSPEEAAYQAMEHEGHGQGHHHAWNVFGRLLSAILELIPN